MFDERCVQLAMDAFHKEGFYPEQVYYVVNNHEIDVLVAFVENTFLVYTPMWHVKAINMGAKTLTIRSRSLCDARHAFSHANLDISKEDLIRKLNDHNFWLCVVGDAIAVYAPEHKPEVRLIILNN